MREIKFRAWCRESTDMHDESPNTNPYHLVEWNPDFFSDMSEVTRWGSEFPDPNDPDTILEQYTGLHDKNGKEIYEGDILRFHMKYQSIDGPVDKMVDRTITFENGSFYYGEYPVSDCEFGIAYEGVTHDHWVIGNIHEVTQ